MLQLLLTLLNRTNIFKIKTDPADIIKVIDKVEEVIHEQLEPVVQTEAKPKAKRGRKPKPKPE